MQAIVQVFAGSNAASRFDASANHALYLLNGPEVAKWLAVGEGLLVDQLLTLEDNTSLAEKAFVTIYSRRPTDSEKRLVAEFVTNEKTDREEAVRELVRTLLCSAEFRFNK